MIAPIHRCPLPNPRDGEEPGAFAERLGQWHCGIAPEDRRRDFGQFLTPLPVARFMAQLVVPTGHTLRILDPGAGAGVLSCCLCEVLARGQRKPRHLELHLYEADETLSDPLLASLRHARHWLAQRGIELTFQIRTDDFVLKHAESLRRETGLFQDATTPDLYDIAISNPPYFKISKADPRAQVAAAVVHGQPNIYALFMGISAALLKPNGQFVCITPRSYSAGPYFRQFREYFFSMMRPTSVHLFGSRTETFVRDEVLQESMILAAQRSDHWWRAARDHPVQISSSRGAGDLDTRYVVPLPTRHFQPQTHRGHRLAGTTHRPPLPA